MGRGEVERLVGGVVGWVGVVRRGEGEVRRVEGEVKAGEERAVGEKGKEGEREKARL